MSSKQNVFPHSDRIKPSLSSIQRQCSCSNAGKESVFSGPIWVVVDSAVAGGTGRTKSGGIVMVDTAGTFMVQLRGRRGLADFAVWVLIEID